MAGAGLACGRRAGRRGVCGEGDAAGAWQAWRAAWPKPSSASILSMCAASCTAASSSLVACSNMCHVSCIMHHVTCSPPPPPATTGQAFLRAHSSSVRG